MAEYVDKQTVLNIIASFRTPYRKEVRVEDVYDAVQKAETVEIIHCKDCCHYPSEYTDCPMIGWHRVEDDFCSFAERRENETD